ncbi:CAAX protease self-immunity-domain-containing protein [Pyronema omphalodes]|nr:CAAX protease self-immunity-domain-containing protein [Pyronema omphalodes]
MATTSYATAPLLSLPLAILLCITFTLLYVSSVYLSPQTRPRPGLDRNTPNVIATRVRIASIITLICTFLTSIILFTVTGQGWWAVLSLMGITHITPTTVWDTIKVLGVTGVLFMGPLTERAWEAVRWHGWRGFVPGVIGKRGRIGWVGWRNYVVAPITEEVVFRGCMVPLLMLAGVSAGKIVWTTPLVFGIAHFHHCYEMILNHPSYIGMAILSSLAQFTYTTIFGWWATFVLIRTGSVWPAIAVHAMCNWIGAPAPKVSSTGWVNGLYWLSLVAGAVGFYKMIWLGTESGEAMMRF